MTGKAAARSSQPLPLVGACHGGKCRRYAALPCSLQPLKRSRKGNRVSCLSAVHVADVQDRHLCSAMTGSSTLSAAAFGSMAHQAAAIDAVLDETLTSHIKAGATNVQRLCTPCMHTNTTTKRLRTSENGFQCLQCKQGFRRVRVDVVAALRNGRLTKVDHDPAAMHTTLEPSLDRVPGALLHRQQQGNVSTAHHNLPATQRQAMGTAGLGQQAAGEYFTIITKQDILACA